MGGGLLQLLAKGPQDIFLTGNPQITFFKKVYKKHTNFAIEQMEQLFLGERDFGKRLRCKIERKGDLLMNMYLAFNLSDNAIASDEEGKISNIHKLGFKLIDYVEIEIGGQVIDRHYGEWMDIWTQLTYNKTRYEMLMGLMRDKISKFANRNNNLIYVPLMFWFNNEPGLALPLISLQFHEVVLYLSINSKDKIKYINEMNTSGQSNIPPYVERYSKLPKALDSTGGLLDSIGDGSGTITATIGEGIDLGSGLDGGETTTTLDLVDDATCSNNTFFNAATTTNNTWCLNNFSGIFNDVYLYCDYIFLDSDERSLFAKSDHEYLITQVQRTNKLGLDTLTTTDNTKNKQFELEFNHPVKEIIWTVNTEELEHTHIYKNLDLTDTLENILLQMNGVDRIKKREAGFFNVIQPFQNHTCGGLIELDSTMYYNGGFYMYSFGLQPENYQPQGTLNFSKLNNFVINFDYKKTSSSYTSIPESYKFTCYGINYNILKISQGMAGIAYKN